MRQATAILMTALGGAIGATLRYLSIQLVNRLADGTFLPGVLAVNILGSLTIGILTSLFRTYRSDIHSLLWVTGVLGGYTTFSSYILEVANHFLNGRVGLGLLDLFLHNVLCLVCVVLGLWLGRLLFS